MKAHRTELARYWSKIIVSLAFSAASFTVSTASAQTVTCNETSLSVNAADIKAEDLIKAIGNECAIKIIIRGEVFTEDVFSVRFENLPVRTGIERILRVVNIPNHMLHFEETAGRKRLIEIDLVGKKGGERQLTPGTAPSAAPDRPSRPSRRTAGALPTGMVTAGQENVPEPPDIVSDEPLEEKNDPAEHVPEEPGNELPEEELEAPVEE
jgi:hypothetical protein